MLSRLGIFNICRGSVPFGFGKEATPLHRLTACFYDAQPHIQIAEYRRIAARKGDGRKGDERALVKFLAMTESEVTTKITRNLRPLKTPQPRKNQSRPYDKKP